MENKPKENLAPAETKTPIQTSPPIYKNKIFLSFVIISFIIAFIVGGFALGTKFQSKPTPVSSPKPTAQAATSTPASSPSAAPTITPSAQSFLKIPEYGVKFALSDSIKDAYYLPATAGKGYVYLKVHSLDSESQCAKDESSTAALSKVGKDEVFELSGKKYSDSFDGVTIGNYYYYIDLAQYECAESVDGKATLVKVRKAFSEASKTITAL